MMLLETVLAAQTENWQLYLGCILLAICRQGAASGVQSRKLS
jgi:hypothetical protein